MKSGIPFKGLLSVSRLCEGNPQGVETVPVAKTRIGQARKDSS